MNTNLFRLLKLINGENFIIKVIDVGLFGTLVRSLHSVPIDIFVDERTKFIQADFASLSLQQNYDDLSVVRENFQPIL